MLFGALMLITCTVFVLECSQDYWNFGLVCFNIYSTIRFSEIYAKEKFSYIEKKSLIERAFLSIKYPHFKSRGPRKLEDFNNWKAAEFR